MSQTPPDYLLKLDRADHHIDALDQAIQDWLNAGGYTLVDKPDPKTGHHVLYAQIKEPLDPDWPLMAGDAVHCLRAALDHLVYAALLKLHGGSLTDALDNSSQFPVVGTTHPKTGNARPSPDNDLNSIVGKDLGPIPNGLREALRNLQPYKRGGQFASHEIWLIHDLDRVDKHRHLHLVTAAAQLRQLSMGGTGHFPYFWFGGGEVKNGDKVCEWADPTGPAPNLKATLACQVILGEPKAGAQGEAVPLLRSLRAYFDSDVLPVFAPFL